MKSLSAWLLMFATFCAAMLLLAAPAVPQSTSKVVDYTLTHVHVYNTPLTDPSSPKHQTLGNIGQIFGAGGHDPYQPTVQVCASESVKPGYSSPESCSQVCEYNGECDGILNPPLPLSSEDASVHIRVKEPDLSPAHLIAADTIVPMVNMYTSQAYPLGPNGFKVTFTINTSYKKTLGLAVSAAKAASKYLATGKLPLPPLIGLSNVAEGATAAYNNGVQTYNRCMDAKASQYGLVSDAQRCRQYTNAEYGSCMAGVLANADHQDVLVATAPEGCAAPLGQSITDTTWQVAKSAVCGIVNWGAALLGTQGCSPATTGTPTAPPYTPFQYCLLGAIQNSPQLRPAEPNLTQQASEMCSVEAGVTTPAQWESCMYNVLIGGTPNVKDLEGDQTAVTQKNNFYKESSLKAQICLNVRNAQAR